MATINIGAENAGDPHYRYKMPKPISKVEGRGNGIKTNVVNNVEIAKALERPPEYILKFMGCELGAQTNFDAKTGTSIVNGAHDANVLMNLTEAFIKKYVQCYSCRNPETVVSIKRENVYLKCKACGHVSEVDMRHKLNNYILKNPPSSGLSKEEKQIKKQEKERLKALKAEKEEKKKEKAKKKKSKSSEAEGGVERTTSKPEDATTEEPEAEAAKEEKEEDDVVWTTDVSAEAIAKRAQEQLTSSAVASMVTQGNIEAEASEAKKKLKKLLAKLEFSEDVISVINELGMKIYNEQSDAEIVEFLSGALNKAAYRMMVLYVVLLWEAPEKLGSIVKNRAQLLKMCAKSAKDQLAQLFGLEYVMAMMISERMKEYPQILKVLYDKDVIDDEIIIGWYQQPAASQKALGITPEGGENVRNTCEAFVEWLQEDEEETDEDEDD